ncbi:MAG: hypothetical protein ACYC9Q_05485 [Bacillota bacterium]
MLEDLERVKIAEITTDSGLFIIVDPFAIETYWHRIRESGPVALRFMGPGATALREKLVNLGRKVVELDASIYFSHPTYFAPATSLDDFARLMDLAREAAKEIPEEVVITSHWGASIDSITASVPLGESGQFSLGPGTSGTVMPASPKRKLFVYAVYAEVEGVRRMVRVEFDLAPEDGSEPEGELVARDEV